MADNRARHCSSQLQAVWGLQINRLNTICKSQPASDLAAAFLSWPNHQSAGFSESGNTQSVDCANAIGTSSTCTIISSVIREWGIRTFGSGYQNFRVWVPKRLGLGTGRKCAVINLIQPGRLRAFHLCCSLLGN